MIPVPRTPYNCGTQVTVAARSWVSTLTPGTATASWPASQGVPAGGYAASVDASGVVSAVADGQPAYHDG
jgi:anti-sigma factor RsiW